MVGAGWKRGLNLSIDYTKPDQRVYGSRTLELLNSHEDPTFLHSILSFHIARHYLPAPKANCVRVVINGESWGIYVNQQQFNKEFLDEWFGTKDGVRWKMPANPGGGRGLAYLGDDIEQYKRRYELKTESATDEAWIDFARVCRTLEQTPPERLEEALDPLFAIDRALWFLALDNVLVNGDGYWIRSSDFKLYRDPRGRFHIIPHDANETFGRPGGPGFGPMPDFAGGGGQGRPGFGRGGNGDRGPGGPGDPGGPGGFGGPGGPGGFDGPDGPFGPGGPGGGGDPFGPGGRGGPGGPGFGRGQGGAGGGLDPLFGAQDSSKPLLSRLLVVPSLRARYLAHVKTIAEEWLDWGKLGPVVEQYRNLIDADVRADTRKLDSYEAFKQGTAGGDAEAASAGGPRRSTSLKQFVEERRKFLLAHAEIAKPAPRITAVSLEVHRDGAVLPDDPTPNEPVVVVARVAPEVAPAQVFVCYATEREAPFKRIAMAGAGDGRFTASIPPLPAGTKVRYYVEARTENPMTASFLPVRAELGALTYTVATN
jgi:hypothetical protein